MKLNMLNEQPTGRDPKDPSPGRHSPKAASSLVSSCLFLSLLVSNVNKIYTNATRERAIKRVRGRGNGAESEPVMWQSVNNKWPQERGKQKAGKGGERGHHKVSESGLACC